MALLLSALVSTSGQAADAPPARADWAVTTEAVHTAGHDIVVTAKTASGRRVYLRVRAVADHGFRLLANTSSTATFTERRTLSTAPPADAPAPPPELQSGEAGYRFGRSGGARLAIGKPALTLAVHDAAGNPVVRLGGDATAPFGLRQTGGVTHPAFNVSFDDRQRLFGLGRQGGPVEKTGFAGEIAPIGRAAAEHGLPAHGQPLLWSSAGWGALLGSPARSHWDAGKTTPGLLTVTSEDREADLLLVTGDGGMTALDRLTASVGRPEPPPKWFFGVWVGRAPYSSRAQLEATVRALRAQRFPFDGVWLDGRWANNDTDTLALDFGWNNDDFPRHAELLKSLRDQGIYTSLWLSPYLREGSDGHREAARQGWLVRKAGGAPARPASGEHAGILDLTAPGVRTFFRGQLDRLLADGVASFELSAHAGVPADARFADGRTGVVMDALLPDVAAGLIHEAVAARNGNGAVFRDGGALARGRPPAVALVGTDSRWEAMAACLRGMLSAGLSGEPYGGCDVGGYLDPRPSDELYARWSAWGLLSPVARLRGRSAREPHAFSETTAAIATRHARLRYSLLPYLLDAALRAHATGAPIARHLALQFPDDPATAAIDDEFMLGDDLLVAPVLSEGARERRVYLPAGKWYSFDAPGERAIEGPTTTTVAAPLERIPIFVRAGAVLPRLGGEPLHLKGGPSAPVRLDIYPGIGQHTVRYQDEGLILSARVVQTDQAITVTLDPVPFNVELRLVRKPAKVMAFEKRAGVSLAVGGDGTRVNASRGAEVVFEIVR